ncbi:hypothetical protein [Calothrix sp. 336/3]|uniref:hypothetical protein n=1 Tax=Calothrix sp. 336/3 TaxID=1337936 RepID=UPI0004E339B0|nr:hypothetical protein [Calothrix sp. 336/3]AKG20482.1 hypothetical protein IJ00_03385 [Calothrix sp. 336/3]
MLKELINTQVSKKEVTFHPGGEPVSFDVTVVNQSEQFATFQVEVLAAGVKVGANNNWYSISPEVCTKKPPGDITQFTVKISDIPTPGFVGLMTLTIRVFSLELAAAENRHVVRLVIPGTGVAAPRVDLPTQDFLGYPGDRIKIPVSLESFTQRTANVTLRFLGIDSSWFPEGAEKRLQIPTGEQVREVWECQIPELSQAASRVYPFTIEVQQPEAPLVTVSGNLTVLPQGSLNLKCHPLVYTIPEKSADKEIRNTATYTLEFHNHSNLAQEVSLDIHVPESATSRWNKLWNKLLRRQSQRQTIWELTPERTELSLTHPTQFNLNVRRQRPWFGWVRRREITVKAITPDNRIEVQNDTQTLELRVLPVIPIWLQTGYIAVTILLSLVVARQIFTLQHEHNKEVNTVRFSGLGTEITSGSNDQTIRRWQVKKFDIHPLGILGKSDKAVRVVRYRPVNNDRVAVGYENGEIQIFNLLSRTTQIPFAYQKDDRVFDITFSKDSQTIFSGHGSGLVLQWNLTQGVPLQPTQQQQVGFAVNAMTLVGEKQNYLAIAGRFNQITLWDWQTNQQIPVKNPLGGQQDYILALGSPDSKPNLLATADNQGNIKLWNLSPCLNNRGECELLDQWTASKEAVRSVALSSDGCYLASGGDDGTARVWGLNREGKRTTDDATGKVIYKGNKPLRSIDIIRAQNQVLVASGGDDYQVRLHRLTQPSGGCE